MKRSVFAASIVIGFAFFGTQRPLCAESKPRLGGSVPAVALPDTAGHLHRLTEFKNKPFVLCFFCGCSPCHDFARLWAQAQETGAVSEGRTAKGPQTVIVFLGDAGAAHQFVSETGLIPAQTLVLTDPSDQSGQQFGVIQCPRVFVLNARGHLTYTNPETAGLRAPLSAAALVSRILTAWQLRKVAGASPPSQKRTAP